VIDELMSVKHEWNNADAVKSKYSEGKIITMPHCLSQIAQ
jgi:hypothetical protein